MGRAPGSLESLRERNRGQVLAVLQGRGAASQADIARETGLSRATVSSLVADLLQEGTVVERTDAERQAPSPMGGRPPRLLTLDPSSGGFLGIDFGRENVRVAVADRAGELLAEQRSDRFEVALDAATALTGARQLIPEALERASLRPERLIGAGVAVSAPVLTEAPGFVSGVIFPSWAGLDLSAELGTALDVPVFVGNDANLGALAEVTFGAGRKARNVLYVMLSEGIGGAVIIDGRIYQGQSGAAGELGHVVVNPEGQICRCGNRGCLATVAGGAALTGALRHTHGPQITLDDVIALVHGGDPGARRLLSDAGQAVGRALAWFCSLLDPGLVIIGGELAPAGHLLLESIQESLDRWISPASGRNYDVVLGELGAKAEALGAIALAMQEISVQTLDGNGAATDSPTVGARG
jgi:predicted NBD/HSP70 family sugar kinase